MAIMSGLICGPIYRLKRTWARIDSNVKVSFMLQDLVEFMNAENNHHSYRTRLAQCQPPSIPYVGLFLRDFTLISDGNPDNITTENGTSLINFEKRRKICTILRILIKHQDVQYPFQSSEELLNYLKSLEVLSEEELWQRSQDIEPKEQSTNTIKTII